MNVPALLILVLVLARWFSMLQLGHYDSECGKCYGDAMTMVFITLVALVVLSLWITKGCQ